MQHAWGQKLQSDPSSSDPSVYFLFCASTLLGIARPFNLTLSLTDPGRKILRTSSSTLSEVTEDAIFCELFKTFESTETLLRISLTMAEG